MRCGTGLILTILLAAVVPWAAHAAEEEPRSNVLHRLMGEPITMFDWGLNRLSIDMDRAAGRVLGDVPVVSKLRSGALYEWRRNRITLYVSARAPDSLRGRKKCNETFGRLVKVLVEGAPEGPGAAGWYLMTAFYPQGRLWPSRFEDLGEELLREVRLEVTLFPPGGDWAADGQMHTRCSGRLDAKPGDLAYEGS